MRSLECFFFFQAEDGIRDGHVTGVQTCALPISPQVPGAFSRSASQHGPSGRGHCLRRRTKKAATAARSEERRVGKEGRAGWGPAQEKKKKGGGEREERKEGEEEEVAEGAEGDGG